MEVHAHSHPEVSGHRKKWTHYVWEFLMLFLAVFCGFLAENQREHMVDRRRENQFMVSLVKDLELDTAQFSRIRIYRIDRLHALDSLILFFIHYPGNSVPAYGYTLAKKLFGHAAFFQNSGTLDQLKSAGGFRLIRRRNVVDSIESYDQQTKRMALRDIYETNLSVDLTKLLDKLFDDRALLKMYADTVFFNKPALLFTQIKLNTPHLGEYLNSVRTFKSSVQLNMDLQAMIKGKAARLIELIRKEYRLPERTPLEE